MARNFILAGLAAVALGCSQAPATVAAPAASDRGAIAPGSRWVAVKSEGLSCATGWADVKEKLEEVAGISQVETFAPEPYCRFFVEDQSLDVGALLDSLPVSQSTLAGWKFVRGGDSGGLESLAEHDSP